MTTTTHEIDELLTGWTESELATDRGRLDDLLTDDFVGIGPVGFVLDKAGWIGRFAQGMRYEHLELDEVTTRDHGDATIVVAHQHTVGMAGDNQMPSDLRVSFTVVPGDGPRPRIAGMQYSFIGLPAFQR